jgi:hypothetical protein
MIKFEVSFNSPQCGWMSIGFSGSGEEFHTTTANMPHPTALPDLIKILTRFLNGETGERVVKWNRDPEEFDFRLVRAGEELVFEIYEYATGDRSSDEKTLVFSHRGNVRDVCSAFCETFRQLYEDRETDEFESNWHQPFPTPELRELESKLS